MLAPHTPTSINGGPTHRRSHPDPASAHGGHAEGDGRLERSSTVLLKIGAALSAVFVMLPAVGFAAVMVILASQSSWHGGEGVLTTESRLGFVAVGGLAIGFAVACALLLRRSLRQGWIALLLVGMGGLACCYIGVRGIVEATGVDSLITALSWGVAATGATLVLGALLGMASRVQGTRPQRG